MPGCGYGKTCRFPWSSLPRSGASFKDAEDKLNMLSGNKMVYPDGSLNSYVEKLLKARVIMLFKKAQTPKAKGSPKEEGANA